MLVVIYLCVRGINFASFYDFAILQVSLVEQEQLTLREHLSSPPVFSGIRVTRYLVLYVCFVDRCLSFCTFSFGHCVVCSSSIVGFWLLPWYLQTLLLTVWYFVFILLNCLIHWTETVQMLNWMLCFLFKNSQWHNISI